MAESTGISWAHATFNPWVGCEKVSPGCAHCYAETMVTGRMGRAGTWGSDGVRERTSASNWKKPARWNALAADGLLPDGSPFPPGLLRPRVFCASLADVFEPRPELDPWRSDLFNLIEQTPNLDWMVLTKRPEVARDWLRARYWPFGGLPPLAHMPESHGCPPVAPDGVYPDNLWIGVSIENARHTYRADVLRQIPAAVRFLSCEPLLGSLFPHSRPLDRSDPAGVTAADDATERATDTRGRGPLDLSGIDWVIVGGESGGRSARPMHPAWAREILLAAAGDHWCDCGVPALDGAGQHSPGCRVFRRPAFHFKQFGSWRPVHAGDRGGAIVGLRPDGSHVDLSKPQAPPFDHVNMLYAGAAPTSGGGLLDGASWREFPPSKGAPVG